MRLYCLLALAAGSSAQLFEHFFGGGHQHQAPQRTPLETYRALWDESACEAFVCHVTLECVQHPRDCSCPLPQDIKCATSDEDGAAYVCVRGGSNGCDAVKPMLALGRSP